jgi:hypothetical protein
MEKGRKDAAAVDTVLHKYDVKCRRKVAAKLRPASPTNTA